MTNPYFLRLGLPVAVIMTSATSAEGVLGAPKKTAVTSLEALLASLHSSSSCTLSCDSFIIFTFQSFLPCGDISQKPTRSPASRPTSSPTSPPTSPPTSSPTFSPVSPVPPPSGGTQFVPTPSGGCTLNPANGAGNNCPDEVPYCMLINNETICSACTGLDSDCGSGKYCARAFTPSGYACAECKTNGTVSFGCSGTRTCGTPSCIADMIEYCSEDHDADWCPRSPTTAPTRTPRPRPALLL